MTRSQKQFVRTGIEHVTNYFYWAISQRSWIDYGIYSASTSSVGQFFHISTYFR